MKAPRTIFAILTLVPALAIAPAAADDFSGGGGSIYFGTGSPNSIKAASNLADDLAINDESGNYVAGILGFYQGNRYRLGGAFQAHGWGGVEFGHHGVDDRAAGVVAAIGGVYGTYTLSHDRMLLNVGGVVGAGRTVLGFSLGNDMDHDANVATFYFEPQVSIGVAALRWFGVEFQFSAPIFLLTEDLTLEYGGNSYTVTGSDMTGITFTMRLTFGRIADV